VTQSATSVRDWFLERFRRAVGDPRRFERRVGAELKFPLVRADGAAADRESVDALWRFLEGKGWSVNRDEVSGKPVGARRPGERNDTVASCETGYCKPEFSLAHAGDLFALDRGIQELRALLREFSDAQGAYFLGYGIQPVSAPGQALLMNQSRSGVWDKVCPSNRVLSKDQGDDVLLFTVNAASHVHVGVDMHEAVRAVNVLNAYAPAQIALTADSSVWRGRADPEYLSVAEKLWDWWEPARARSGLPPRAFRDLDEYVDAIAAYRPIYVKREAGPVVLPGYESFADYFAQTEAEGRDLAGNPVRVRPLPEDIDLHSSCYWYTARVSRYYTVENRACDQQPPADLSCIAALTLGLVSDLDRAWEAVRDYDWEALRAGRDAACRDGLQARVAGRPVAELVRTMLDRATEGLKNRERGEEAFLAPLTARLEEGRCPGREARERFAQGGAEALVAARRL